MESFTKAKVLEQEYIVSKLTGRRTRRMFNHNFKAKVALAALREEKTLAKMCCQQFELHPTQIVELKKLLLSSATGVLSAAYKVREAGIGNRFFRTRENQCGIIKHKKKL